MQGDLVTWHHALWWLMRPAVLSNMCQNPCFISLQFENILYSSEVRLSPAIILCFLKFFPKI